VVNVLSPSSTVISVQPLVGEETVMRVMPSALYCGVARETALAEKRAWGQVLAVRLEKTMRTCAPLWTNPTLMRSAATVTFAIVWNAETTV
jgi:hypothetical protein